MTQEVSEANRTIFDAGAAQAGAAMLHVPVDFANAQACKVFIVGTRTEEGQELQCVEHAFGACYRTQPAQVSKPRVVVMREVAVKGFERVAWWVRNRGRPAADAWAR